MSSLSLTLNTEDCIMNGLEAYTVLGRIGGSNTSTVYRVVCKAGRLRNRELALKKTVRSTFPLLHQTFHHPNIVSLFSAFSLPQGNFQVLEICSIGSLSEFLHSRNPSTLDESELRGVVKSLCDALTYLRKELVVHRSIQPSKIMLTGEYGVKLSGFGSAVKVHAVDPTVNFLGNVPNYTAPEVHSKLPYGFAADVWSVGSVMLACVLGCTPFEGDTILEILASISRADYTLPDELSIEAKQLMHGILQVQPLNRIPLPNVISHPFFLKPFRSLRPSSKLSSTSFRPSSANGFPAQNHSSFSAHKNIPSRRSSDRLVSLPLLSSRGNRVVLGDIANLKLRAILDENAINPIAPKPNSDPSARRIVSDPVPAKPAFLQAVYGPTSLQTDVVIGRVQLPDKLNTLESFFEPTSIIEKPQRSTSILPIGTTRPIQFTTSLLCSQTHKTTYGQVTILPSRCVLVDFRESQRRRGLKGEEVLVVDPLGSKISVYSAPHLSAPCCLLEPTQEFSIDALPPMFWKQYNDAGRLVEQIKQRTPRLVMYTDSAKCTLMSNLPEGDIELIFGLHSGSESNQGGRPHLGKYGKSEKREKHPSMRLRFSRQSQSIEIAQYVTDTQGEQWTKESLSSIQTAPHVAAKDWSSLDGTRKEALYELATFVRVCQAIEGLEDVDSCPETSPREHTTTIIGLPIEFGLPLEKRNTKYDESSGNHPYSTPPITPIISSSSLTIPPRPKFSTAATVRPTPKQECDQNEADDDGGTVWQRCTPRSDYASVEDGEQIRSKSGLLRGIGAGKPWYNDESDMSRRARNVQTRFIPSVGWCIRYASCVSQGGRYRIMFLDGVALDIDVDEDWVELESRTGEITRVKIRDCGSKRKIGERMKVFEEFVSLFDDSQLQSTL